MSQKKVTFDDIARYTNFSKTTISRYFNNPDSLTLKNQEIIAQALIDLDYKENKVAKILASGKQNLLVLLFQICICTTILKCLTKFFLLMKNSDTSFLFLPETQMRL